MTSMTLPFVGTSGTATSASANTLFGAIFGTDSYTGGTSTTQYYSSSYKSYYIPSTLKKVVVNGGKILYGAFYGCSKLTSVTIPDNVTGIGDKAFYGCSGLTSFTIPETVTDLGNFSFQNCSKLPSINIPNSVTTIGNSAFEGCSNLKALTIPSAVTTIGTYAFQNCTSLTSCVLPADSKLASIKDYTFSGCSKLQRMDLPVSVKTIGTYAFQNCSSMTEVKLPSSLNSIGNYAFTGCTALNDVYTYTIEPQSIDQNTFSTYQTATLHCPKVSYYNYYYDTQWSQFLNLVDFDEDYDYVYIEKDFTIDTDNGTIGGDPDLEINPGGGLTIEGAFTQCFKNIRFYFNVNLKKGSSLIGHDNVQADAIYFDLTVKADYWHFFCFPFDVDLTKIIKEGSYIFRCYDPELRAKGGSGWVDVEGTTLQAGKGYIFRTNLAGQLTIPVSLPNFSLLKVSELLFATKTETDNAVDKNWNFGGNPHLSYYDINDMDYNAPIITFNGTNYEAYRPGDDEYALSPFQAFFVQKPNDKDQIGFANAGRSTYLQTQNAAARAQKRARKAALLDADRKLINLSVTDGVTTDKCRVVFNDNKSLEYELGCDASKFLSTEAVPQIYSLDNDGVRYAINERPVMKGGVELGFIAPADGEYTLEAPRMDVNMVLIDNETGFEHNFVEGGYTFDAKAGTYENRFVLRIAATPTAIDTVEGSGEAQESPVYDLQGKRVKAADKGVYVKNGKKFVK